VACAAKLFSPDPDIVFVSAADPLPEVLEKLLEPSSVMVALLIAISDLQYTEYARMIPFGSSGGSH